jgi:hypothetical protein
MQVHYCNDLYSIITNAVNNTVRKPWNSALPTSVFDFMWDRGRPLLLQFYSSVSLWSVSTAVDPFHGHSWKILLRSNPLRNNVMKALGALIRDFLGILTISSQSSLVNRQ